MTRALAIAVVVAFPALSGCGEETGLVAPGWLCTASSASEVAGGSFSAHDRNREVATEMAMANCREFSNAPSGCAVNAEAGCIPH